MKTWAESATTSARGTSYILFFGGIAAAGWFAAEWMADVVGIVPTVLLAAFITFAIGTFLVRIVSRLRAEAESEQQARAAEFEARKAEIDANIRRARTMAHQASSWRPDVPLH